MSSFGDRLKEAREARGLSLNQVAEATRIAPHHLKALERGDLEALPAGPFAKGYIEACAKVLEVDAGPILEAYRVQARRSGLDTAQAQSRTLDELSQIVGQRSGGAGETGWRSGLAKGLAVAVVAAGLVGIGGWLVMRGPGPDDGAEPTPGRPATERATEGVPPETRSRGPALAGEGASAAEADTGVAPPHPAPTPAAANPDIEVPDFGVGTGVENHRLVGAGDRFPEGSEVVFWTRVLGGNPGDVIHHVWLHEGRGIARIPLRIGGSHWRTYSRRLLPRGSTGRWTVEVRGLDGSLLARQEFLCVPREP